MQDLACVTLVCAINNHEFLDQIILVLSLDLQAACLKSFEGTFDDRHGSVDNQFPRLDFCLRLLHLQ